MYLSRLVVNFGWLDTNTGVHTHTSIQIASMAKLQPCVAGNALLHTLLREKVKRCIL